MGPAFWELPEVGWLQDVGWLSSCHVEPSKVPRERHWQNAPGFKGRRHPSSIRGAKKDVWVGLWGKERAFLSQVSMAHVIWATHATLV